MVLIRFVVLLAGLFCVSCTDATEELAARQALSRATRFLRMISTNGGYVGIYSLDLKQRYGEALFEKAGDTQIWVQPPGTPSVGEVFLRAHRITGDSQYLDAARDAGRALAWGQSQLGGWDHRVDVADLTAEAVRPERKGGRGTFDDDITQGAIKFLMQLDEELDEPWLDESVLLALRFVMKAQYDNGSWPQWYPLRGGYHDYATFNDNSINDCIYVLLDAHRRYREPAYVQAARRGGQFIIDSQLADPQAGWAQQYSSDLQPAWARRFEPPGVCSAATARNIRTLVDLYLYTGEERFLDPIPDAIGWLTSSQLPRTAIVGDDRRDADPHPCWARLYEVGTNRPVYGDRENPGKMIYDIHKVSQRERSSYGWQGTFAIPQAIAYYEDVKRNGRDQVVREQHTPLAPAERRRRARSLESRVHEVISQLDHEGRWVSGDMLHIGTFVSNMNLLCEYLECVTSLNVPPQGSNTIPAAGG